MKTQRKIKNVEIDVGKEMIRSLTETLETVKTGGFTKLTLRTARVAEVPHAPTPKQIMALRESLDLSQPVFAELLGVSPMLVRAWEQGQRVPSKLACRLLDEIRRQPAYWRAKVQAA